jgi:hypothetical protein
MVGFRMLLQQALGGGAAFRGGSHYTRSEYRKSICRDERPRGSRERIGGKDAVDNRGKVGRLTCKSSCQKMAELDIHNGPIGLAANSKGKGQWNRRQLKLKASQAVSETVLELGSPGAIR